MISFSKFGGRHASLALGRLKLVVWLLRRHDRPFFYRTRTEYHHGALRCYRQWAWKFLFEVYLGE